MKHPRLSSKRFFLSSKVPVTLADGTKIILENGEIYIRSSFQAHIHTLDPNEAIKEHSHVSAGMKYVIEGAITYSNGESYKKGEVVIVEKDVIYSAQAGTDGCKLFEFCFLKYDA
jgi:gentisate 1,2-dioxygenase